MKNKKKKYLLSGIAAGILTGGLVGLYIGYTKYQKYIAAGKILDDAIKEVKGND